MRLRFSMLLIAVTVLIAGCEESYLDHDPPDGMGSIVIDNGTLYRLNVFLDGYEINRVDAFDYEIMDMPPGEYRLVLEERHGVRSYRSDIDVLAQRLTVLEVFDGATPYSYNVHVSFYRP